MLLLLLVCTILQACIGLFADTGFVGILPCSRGRVRVLAVVSMLSLRLSGPRRSHGAIHGLSMLVSRSLSLSCPLATVGPTSPD